MSSSPQYELVVYGATGYTGRYTAEYLHESGPKDLKWAIAGRDATKLNNILDELRKLSPRPLPSVEVSQHNVAALENLASKTKVLISTVGPFCKYGTPVVEACVRAGTDYLDITGEGVWVHEIIERFHEKARKDGVVLIPQAGVESIPSDIITYSMVKYAREHFREGLLEAINSTQDMKLAMSGGSMDSAFSMMGQYSLFELQESTDPFYLSPVTPNPIQQQAVGSPGVLSSLLGYIKVPELGYLTDWPFNGVDRTIVHRSWALFDKGELYGNSFRFAHLRKSASPIQAIVQAMVFRLIPILLVLPPVQWLAKKVALSPGEGPSRTEIGLMVNYKALGTTESGKRITAEVNLKGSLYYWTAVLVAEAALELAKGNGGRARQEGGVVTPAMLEQGLIDRLANAGFKIHLKSSL